MGAAPILTSLNAVRQYLAIPDSNTASDELLMRMIKSCSAFVLGYLNLKSFALTEYTETYDGYGKNWMPLRQNPVYDIVQVGFAGTAIPAAKGDGFSAPYTSGYWLDGDYSLSPGRKLYFGGYATPRGRGTIFLKYRAGFVNTEEVLVPGASPYSVAVSYFWLGDVSVTDGLTTLELVSSNPQPGQYTAENGVYTFNEADASVIMQVMYSYVPADIEQAVVEMVGERYKYMDRIGYVSKSLGGQETVTFSQKSMSDYIKSTLQPLINVVPI